MKRRSDNGEQGVVGVQRRREVALFNKHVADPVMRDGEVALPSGISGIGLCEAFGDLLTALIARQSRGQGTARHLMVADEHRDPHRPASAVAVLLRREVEHTAAVRHPSAVGHLPGDGSSVVIVAEPHRTRGQPRHLLRCLPSLALRRQPRAHDLLHQPVHAEVRRAVVELAPGDEAGLRQLVECPVERRLGHHGVRAVEHRLQYVQRDLVRRHMREHADHRRRLRARRAAFDRVAFDDVVERQVERRVDAAAVAAVRRASVGLVGPELGEAPAIRGERQPPVAAAFAPRMRQRQRQTPKLLGQHRRLLPVALLPPVGGLAQQRDGGLGREHVEFHGLVPVWIAARHYHMRIALRPPRRDHARPRRVVVDEQPGLIGLTRGNQGQCLARSGLAVVAARDVRHLLRPSSIRSSTSVSAFSARSHHTP